MTERSSSDPATFFPAATASVIPSQRPSVPLSLYRELVKELQVTQTQIEVLEAQNQQIVKENHQLRQEIDKVIEHGKNLEKIIQANKLKVDTLPMSRTSRNPSFMIATPRPKLATPSIPSTSIKSLPSPSTQIDKTSDLNWILIITIFLIVISFGVGGFYLVNSHLGKR